MMSSIPFELVQHVTSLADLEERAQSHGRELKRVIKQEKKGESEYLIHLRNEISFFEVHWDMNCSWSRDKIYYNALRAL